MNDEYRHPAFPPPPSLDATLWRYLDVEKFDWLVANRRNFMPSAQFLGDPLEGTAPAGHHHRWADLAQHAESDEQREIIKRNEEKLGQFAAAFRPHYYVSCWHVNERENLRMWRAYTKTPDAVAISTSYRALRAALPRYVEMGMVRYIDYSKERLPTLNMLEYITHKNVEFEFEQELRAVTLPPATDGLGAAHFRDNLFEMEARSEFRVFAPEFDVSSLVHRVVLHPEATPKFHQKIQQMCATAKLPQPVYGGGSSAL
jgi:hypothetical protein